MWSVVQYFRPILCSQKRCTERQERKFDCHYRRSKKIASSNVLQNAKKAFLYELPRTAIVTKMSECSSLKNVPK